MAEARFNRPTKRSSITCCFRILRAAQAVMFECR